MGKSTTQSRSTEVGACLDTLWAALREVIPGLAHAVPIPLDVAGRRRKRGHFSAGGWDRRNGELHEIAVSPLLFNRPKDLICTVVHEAVHAALYDADPHNPSHRAGCSRRDHYYHRTEFRDKAIELGLRCEFLNSRYGWTKTTWPNGAVPAMYRPIVEMARRQMPAGSKHVAEPQIFRRSSLARISVECGCTVPRRISIQVDQWQLGLIKCAVCDRTFARLIH